MRTKQQALYLRAPWKFKPTTHRIQKPLEYMSSFLMDDITTKANTGT
jgi:hypothetical protein